MADKDIPDGAMFGRPQENSSTATSEHNSVPAMEFICIPPVRHNDQPNFDYFESSKKLLKSRAGAEYDMRHERRGPALIFNQETFEEQNDTSETPMERRSSDRDVAAFKNQLEHLGFDVQQYVDYKKADLLDKIQKLAEEDHTQNDCILIAIFSVGEYNGKIWAHDTWFKLNEILEKFTDVRCPTLKGKPKLFFLEGCQGQGIDLSLKILSRESDGKSFELQHPDFLIAHPAAHGFKTYRRIGYGSWFIQSLCRELERNGTNLDLITILTFVSQHVARHETTGGEQQLPCFRSTLTRIVRFDEKKH